MVKAEKYILWFTVSGIYTYLDTEMKFYCTQGKFNMFLQIISLTILNF